MNAPKLSTVTGHALKLFRKVYGAVDLQSEKVVHEDLQLQRNMDIFYINKQTSFCAF